MPSPRLSISDHEGMLGSVMVRRHTDTVSPAAESPESSASSESSESSDSDSTGDDDSAVSESESES